jgi:predicted metal-dependent hydrolase
MNAERGRVLENWRDTDEFRQSVRDWAAIVRVTPFRVRVQEMRRKWASCSPAGVVSFSSDLLTRDRAFGEAVIVHELLHLRVRNHGRLFQSLMKSFLGPHLYLSILTEGRSQIDSSEKRHGRRA